jgi:Domain of unknown function (DUF4062)
MSEIRYQVFVSSTFMDLKEERISVSQALMEMNCIPAGMELFPATNEVQFDFIKTVIDESDYYVLIVGARYGSVDSEGVSFTEREFDYAVSKNIEICAFIHSNIENIAVAKTDKDPILDQKLVNFRSKVSTGRLIKYWDDPKELAGKVVTSLNSAIRRKPALGWMRGNRQASSDLVAEIISLKDENTSLKNQLLRQKTEISSADSNDLNRPIRVDYFESNSYGALSGGYESDKRGIRKNISVTIADIIEKIGSKLQGKEGKIDFLQIIPNYGIVKPTFAALGAYGEKKYIITDESEQRIELALTALGYAKKSTSNSNLYILTEKGNIALFNIMTSI